MTATADDLARNALAVNYANLALGRDVFHADGATFVRDTALPEIIDANHVVSVTASAPDEIERLLARVEREYAHCAHRVFRLDFTTPPAFAARLALDGYSRSDDLIMLLEGDLLAPDPGHAVRIIDDDAGWRAYDALKQLDWDEYLKRQNRDEAASVGEAIARANRSKSPPLRYWLAYLDGEPRGFFTSWEGIDGMGQVEDLFVHPGCRHRGLATSLMRRCVDDCRAQGAGPIVIVCDPTDTPKHMYAAMGYRPIATASSYLRRLPR